MLNQFNTSESNILSVANNQLILHHFLFEKDVDFISTNIANRPKTYFPHRTNTSYKVKVGNEEIEAANIQIEIDLTVEYMGIVGVFEAKNISSNNFSVFQLYNPFIYYMTEARKREISAINKIVGVFLSKEIAENCIIMHLWAYTFSEPHNLASIKLEKSATYKLIPTP